MDILESVVARGHIPARYRKDELKQMRTMINDWLSQDQTNIQATGHNLVGSSSHTATQSFAREYRDLETETHTGDNFGDSDGTNILALAGMMPEDLVSLDDEWLSSWLCQ